jgi:hypothetical protein
VGAPDQPAALDVALRSWSEATSGRLGWSQRGNGYRSLPTVTAKRLPLYPSATHSDVVGHERPARALTGRLVRCHFDALAVGFVEVSTKTAPLPTPADPATAHSDADAQLTSESPASAAGNFTDFQVPPPPPGLRDTPTQLGPAVRPAPGCASVATQSFGVGQAICAKSALVWIVEVCQTAGTAGASVVQPTFLVPLWTAAQKFPPLQPMLPTKSPG